MPTEKEKHFQDLAMKETIHKSEISSVPALSLVRLLYLLAAHITDGNKPRLAYARVYRVSDIYFLTDVIKLVDKFYQEYRISVMLLRVSSRCRILGYKKAGYLV